MSTDKIHYEGDSYSKIRQMITKGNGAKQGLRMELATVIAEPPSLQIKLDADNLVLDADDLIVLERLSKHKRNVTFTQSTDAKFTTNMRIKSSSVSEAVTPASDITALELSDIQTDFTLVEMEMEYNDELRIGDRVIVACLEDDMIYVVLDRAVFY